MKRGITPRPIIAICNPLIDMTLEVEDKSFLEAYQLKTGHAVLATHLTHKKLLEVIWKKSKDPNGKVIVAPGGSGLNTIRAANVTLCL